ncbi:MAG: radical SAM protein [Nanoarchaeota archaeon]
MNSVITIDDVVQGKNSVLFSLPSFDILYERLSNTLHAGSREELLKVMALAESVAYKPVFDRSSLKESDSGDLESLILNITEKCNLDCTYCIYGDNYVGERANTGKDMDSETAEKAIDIYVGKSRSKALIVGFYGGEPFLNMALIRRVMAHSKEKYPDKQFIFSLTSNFYHVGHLLEEIANNGLYVNISLDGPKEIHDKHRITKCGKGTYDDINESLGRLEGISPGFKKSHITINATYQDPEDFRPIVDFLIDHDGEYLSMRVGGAESKGAFTRRDQSGIIPALLNYAGMYADKILAYENPPAVLRAFFDQSLDAIHGRSRQVTPQSIPLNGSCYPGERKLFCDTDGTLYMCEKFGQRLPLGNVGIGYDRAAVDDTIARYTSILNDQCAGDCWAQRLCTPCILSAKDANSDMSSKGLAEKCPELNFQTLLGLAIYAIILHEDKDALHAYLTKEVETCMT